jgi:hypothetical protein
VSETPVIDMAGVLSFIFDVIDSALEFLSYSKDVEFNGLNMFFISVGFNFFFREH